MGHDQQIFNATRSSEASSQPTQPASKKRKFGELAAEEVSTEALGAKDMETRVQAVEEKLRSLQQSSRGDIEVTPSSPRLLSKLPMPERLELLEDQTNQVCLFLHCPLSGFCISRICRLQYARLASLHYSIRVEPDHI